MPEGHTLHRLARELHTGLAGTTPAVSSPQRRFVEAEALSGELLLRAYAVGKHLLLQFESTTVHVHLGLFGRVFRNKSPAPAPRETIRLRLVGLTRTWDICGPTCCACIDEAALAALVSRIGADPLSAHNERQVVTELWQKLKRTRRPIGALLLDQRLMSGIGNVYRAEILFMLKMNPLMPGKSLSRIQVQSIWRLAVTLLAKGAKAGRIVTTAQLPGMRKTKRESLHVYRKRECSQCASAILALDLAGRPLYACPQCQSIDASTAALAQPRPNRSTRSAEALAMQHY